MRNTKQRIKRLKSILLLISINVFICSSAYAAVHYVSPTGSATWESCSGTTPLSGTTACSLSTANQNAVAGDTIYLREGSYSITGDAIAPSNSGTSKDNMITFSGYNNEVVTIYGVNNSNGKNSRGINLYGKSYIKVTSLIFTNLANYLYITNGSHHNEISYCTFKDIRDVWNVDVFKTGIHTGPTGSSTVLVDSALGGGTNTYAYRRIENVTDGSSSYMSNASDATTVTHSSYPLSGGKKNYWTTGDEYKITSSISWAGSYIFEGNVPKAAVSHNWIHHNIFKNYGAYSTHDEGVALELGVGNSGAQMNNDYNTIENNHMYAAGHHVLGVNASRYNVIRNNYIHNEGWYSRGKCSEKENGVCGYRVVSATVPSTTFGGRSLWEGNRIGHGAAYGGPHLGIDGASGSGTTLATPSNIYRYNDHFNNALYGLRLGASISAAGNGNRVYNNTFYHNGYGADDDAKALDTYRGAISLYNDTCAGISGSVIKNNLMYDHWVEQNRRTLTTSHAPVIDAVSAENLTCNTITNNYGTGTTYLMSSSSYSSVDPLFTDSDVTTPLSEKPDLSLRPESSAINAGTYLTLANGPGSSSITLVVNDAGYFQDGTWGSDLARGSAGNFYADWIAIGTIDNVVQIQSIDYSTNTITLKTPMTWNSGAPIWLYTKSDGAQVFYGSAPDMGAHERSIQKFTGNIMIGGAGLFN